MNSPFARVFATSLVLACTVCVLTAAGPDAALASGFSALMANKSIYSRGDQLRLCWLLPAAGTMTLTDHDPSGIPQVLRSGQDQGSGCVGGKLTGPVGHECETLDFDTPRGSGSTRTCFDVVDDAVPPTAAATGQPQLTMAGISGDDNSLLEISGTGYQTFSGAAHGVTIFVKRADGSEVDADEIFPDEDGTLRLTLHTASYPPGDYTVGARYTFITAGTGVVNDISTSFLGEGFTFTVE